MEGRREEEGRLSSERERKHKTTYTCEPRCCCRLWRIFIIWNQGQVEHVKRRWSCRLHLFLSLVSPASLENASISCSVSHGAGRLSRDTAKICCFRYPPHSFWVVIATDSSLGFDRARSGMDRLLPIVLAWIVWITNITHTHTHTPPACDVRDPLWSFSCAGLEFALHNTCNSPN